MPLILLHDDITLIMIMLHFVMYLIYFFNRRENRHQYLVSFKIYFNLLHLSVFFIPFIRFIFFLIETVHNPY